MKPLKTKDLLQYVEENIGTFHQKRIAGLDALKLAKVFANSFCLPNSAIDWNKLVQFNSEATLFIN